MSDEQYPETITADMLPKWAHISDGAISRDIVDTEREIEHHEWETRRRKDFVAFMRRLRAAREAQA